MVLIPLIFLGGFLLAAKTGLSACIFLLLLAKSRSASPHVEGCFCGTAAIKRIPLLSRAAMSSNVRPVHCLTASLLHKLASA